MEPEPTTAKKHGLLSSSCSLRRACENSDGGGVCVGGGGVDEGPCDEFVERAFSAETCHDFGRVRL
jgi:hypothetical protein